MTNAFYIKESLDCGRVVKIRDGITNGPVLYWMNRDQRLSDNHALAFSQSLAIENRQPVVVYFGLDLSPGKYNDRQVSFLVEGLERLEADLLKCRVPFVIKVGPAVDELVKFIDSYKVGTVVTDFSPLRQDRRFLSELPDKISSGIYQVDAHNVVPCRAASDKKEFAAYTIRPKITRLLEKYSQEAPVIGKHPYKLSVDIPVVDWISLKNEIGINYYDNTIISGESAAFARLDSFVSNKLEGYAELRNDPNADNQSGLSAYLHFGQISSRTVFERVQASCVSFKSIEQFTDELIVRKELSDNFCYYQPDYDTVGSFPDWSRQSLDGHRSDPREVIYSREEFEIAETGDRLWNAAQTEMVTTGKMHGYMRMYWAKKILEWTPSAEIAMETAVYLNDKYQLDGNDPNGYAGIAWSIGGVHDRAWFERDIFGKVRYMNYNGCKRKFNVNQYIKRNSVVINT